MTALLGRDTARLKYQFRMFHAEHPEVYDWLVRLTRRQLVAGNRHLGIAMIWETMRYNTMLGDKKERPRLNNNHRAFYARLIMQREPDLRGVFELRTAAADIE